MPRILFVDDDPVLRQVLSAILGRGGYEVITAADGVEGLAKVESTQPDLIITDVNMPKMDGWTFVRTLRARPEHAWTPVFFLTDRGMQADRIQGFQLGADDYLRKPVPFEELHLRIARALETRNQLRSSISLPAPAGTPKRPQTGVGGKLDQIGLATLLTMLEQERRTGELSLSRPPDDMGRLLIRDGRVVEAKAFGTEALDGREAVYGLICWADGAFAFRPMAVEAEDSIGRPVGALLLEGARRADEAAARS